MTLLTDLFSLDGQVAVVTGGTGVLGGAMARGLALAGAKIGVLGRRRDQAEATVRAIEADGGAALALPADVLDRGQLEAARETVLERWGRLDILVNNVGGSRNARIWEMTVEDWDFVLRLNLRPTFLCTRAATPHMIRQKYGRIVCMSSGAREGTPWTAYYQGGSAYSAAKAGVHGFVRDVALELAEHKINVNAVAPGPIDTERFGPGLKRMNETVEYSPNHMTPLRRLGEPFEVAHAVLFLASEEASYVTGHTLAVTGGR
jgi:NAD(P)-dependent dehydrogenase (short-subunit alcohol dehydrogenase family)